MRYNGELRPTVVAPGDEFAMAFPEHPKSVKGYWRGQPDIKIINKDDLPQNVLITGTGSDRVWSDESEIRDASNFDTECKPRAVIIIPDDPALAGKSLELKITMEVTFPKTIDQNGRIFTYENRTRKTERTIVVHVATRESATKAKILWWGALLLCWMLLLISSIILVTSSYQRRGAISTQIPALEILEIRPKE